MQFLIPDVFSHIAPFLEADDWKSFRRTCRLAEALFDRFCESMEMVFRTGRPLALRGEQRFPVTHYPCSEYNRDFYLCATRDILHNLDPQWQFAFLEMCNFGQLSLSDARFLFGSMFDEVVKFVNGEISSIRWVSVDTIMSMAAEDFLIYLANMDTQIAVWELRIRGASCWDVYRGRGLSYECPAAYEGDHEQFALDFLTKVPDSRICWNRKLCMDCRLGMLSAAGHHKARDIMRSILCGEYNEKRIRSWLKSADRYCECPMEFPHKLLSSRKAQKIARYVNKARPGLIRCAAGHECV